MTDNRLRQARALITQLVAERDKARQETDQWRRKAERFKQQRDLARAELEHRPRTMNDPELPDGWPVCPHGVPADPICIITHGESLACSEHRHTPGHLICCKCALEHEAAERRANR